MLWFAVPRDSPCPPFPYTCNVSVNKFEQNSNSTIQHQKMDVWVMPLLCVIGVKLEFDCISIKWFPVTIPSKVTTIIEIALHLPSGVFFPFEGNTDETEEKFFCYERFCHQFKQLMQFPLALYSMNGFIRCQVFASKHFPMFFFYQDISQINIISKV